MNHRSTALDIQKQPSRGVLSKRCSEDMQQIYWGTPMPKCDFNKVAKQLYEITLRHGCSPVNLLHISRTPFTINTSERVLLDMVFGQSCLWKIFTKYVRKRVVFILIIHKSWQDWEHFFWNRKMSSYVIFLATLIFKWC